jgi:Predicted AAA-ATPase/PD-(D/E)XK nuclease superfamily
MKKGNLPIGIQDFRTLRERNYLYVDKTELIFNLLNSGEIYFLSRPRRFGKSLTISTLKEIFSGSRELFEGLWIENQWDWSQKHPVIHLSFAAANYQGFGLPKAIEYELEKCARQFDIALETDHFKAQFEELIKKMDARYGRVVVLIDEYDKPIIDYLEYERLPLAKENQGTMKAFYSVLKDAGTHLRFVFITGVSKFSKVSVFSDLNHLKDVTLHPDYATLTGYTQEELEFNFADYLDSVETRLNLPREPLLKLVREWYNGFSWDGIQTVYNPFGILNFLDQKNFQNFWFTTGTPTFLAELMKEQTIFEFENIEINSLMLEKYDIENLNLVPLLFQTGYLTIRERDLLTGDLVLDYPNKEVRESMYRFLIDNLARIPPESSSGQTVKHLAKAFFTADLDRVKTILDTLFADLAYNLHEKNARRGERFYHGIIHLMFKYLGVHVQSEVHTSQGRSDAVVQTPTHVYIFEFKYNKSAEEAIDQIVEKGYADPYRASGKTIVGIGVNFSGRKKAINGWIVNNAI